MAADINKQSIFIQDTGGSQVSGRTTVAAPPKHPASLIVLATLLVPAILSYALVTTNESRVLAMVLALLGAGIVTARPFWGLIFFVGLLYLRPEEIFPALQGMRLSLIISLVTLLALVFQKLLNREKAVKSPVNAMIVGFGVAVVLSTMGKGNTGVAFQEILKLVILVFLVINLASSPQRSRALITTVILFSGYLAAYSIYLHQTGRAMQYQDLERSMATGIFSDPNDLAATIVAGMALVLMRIRGAGVIARAFYIALVAVMLWAVILTDSRGGTLALLCVVGGFLYYTTRYKTLAIVLAVVFGALFMAVGPSRMTSFDSGEESANMRFWFWSDAIESLPSYPFLGVGYGQFADTVGNGHTAHNSFVLCFTETGLIGYFFWMGCIYYAFRRRPALQSALPESSDDGNSKGSTVAVADWQELVGTRLALAGFLTAGFFLSRTYVPVMYLLMCLPVAQQLAMYGPLVGSAAAQENESPRTRQHGRCDSTSNQIIENSQTYPTARDWKWIALISLGSILFIYQFALQNR